MNTWRCVSSRTTVLLKEMIQLVSLQIILCFSPISVFLIFPNFGFCESLGTNLELLPLTWYWCLIWLKYSYFIPILMFWNFIVTWFVCFYGSSRWKSGLRIVYILNLNTVKASKSVKSISHRSQHETRSTYFTPCWKDTDVFILDFQTRYHLKDVIIGKIYFLLVKIKLKNMELEIRRRESTGSGPNTYVETETLAKFELMDGAPVRGTLGNFSISHHNFTFYIFNVTILEFYANTWDTPCHTEHL